MPKEAPKESAASLTPEHVLRTITISQWEDARKLALQLTGWTFRGQRDAKWWLEPTIERHCNSLPGDLPKAIAPHKAEEYLLSRFQRYAHAFLQSPPPPDKILEWLSIMQHHGAPTRLLDVTHSFYVAAFFAFESSSTDVAVWAFFRPLINAILILNNQKRSPKVQGKSIASEEFFDANYNKPIPHHAAAFLEPRRPTQRVVAQQGSFLCSLNSKYSLEENLFGMFGLNPREARLRAEQSPPSTTIVPFERGKTPPSIIKITISQNAREDALKDLRKMNITWTSLFPGLDGYARDLNLELISDLRPTEVYREEALKELRKKAQEDDGEEYD